MADVLISAPLQDGDLKTGLQESQTSKAPHEQEKGFVLASDDGLWALALSLGARKRLAFIHHHHQIFLKISLQAGGCSGFQYQLSLVKEPEPCDLCFKDEEIKIYVPASCFPLLQGTRVDYEEEMMGATFVLKTPQAVSSCGCGQSFSVF